MSQTTKSIIWMLFLVGIMIAKSLSAYAGPLHDAAKEGDLKTVRQLITTGSDPNETDPENDDGTTLHEAVNGMHMNVVEYLLKNGADVNVITGKGIAPLHIASTININFVRLLIKFGANLDAQDKLLGYTPLHQAASRAKLDIVKYLLARGADKNIEATHPVSNRAKAVDAAETSLAVGMFPGEQEQEKLKSIIRLLRRTD